MNVASWVARAGLSRPSDPAIALGDFIASDYARLARRAAGLATTLRERHRLSPGDRVAIVGHNHPGYLETLFGIWWAGLAAVPINAKLHRSEISWILGHAEAGAVFVSPGLAADVGGIQGLVQPVTAFASREYERSCAENAAPLEPRHADDLAWLFYTSGTTGRPKGAMLTHRNLTAMSLAYLSDLDPTRPGDAVLHAAPMSHGSGLYAIPHVCRMAVNVIPESGRFQPPEVAGLLRRWPRTSMFAAPTMIQRLVESDSDIDSSRMRTLIWGGAPMHVADVERALERLGPCLAQIYGQGETPMTITHLAKEDVAATSDPCWPARVGSAGIPAAVVEVRVVDTNDNVLRNGETGEVLVRGETVMRGYWSDADATASALRGGWLHTGDLGSFDDAGYLTLKDRSNDLIISGGSNIYPREVEEVLASHAGVDEVSVIGRPDPHWGEIVVAYVVGDASTQDLDQVCLARIARFKRPKEYVFVSSLPKNNNGKILKKELRALDGRRRAVAGPPEISRGT